MTQINVIGQMDNSDGSMEIANRIYDSEGLSPCLNAHASDTVPKMIVAMRGRDVNQPTRRKKQNPDNPFQQRLEVQQEGLSNTLTTFNKDNLVLEPSIVQKVGDRDKDKFSVQQNYSNCIPANPMSDREQMLVEPITTSGKQTNIAKTILAGYERTNMTGFNSDNAVLTSEEGGKDVSKKYRIRKLTPKECFRLMGVKDEDYDKLTVSDSQRYKQAGNSIVVDVLMAIFENMFVNECESNSLF